MIRAIGWLSIIASLFVVGYTLHRSADMQPAYPVADRWYHPSPGISYDEEIKLVPRIVALLRANGKPLHPLGLKAGLRLSSTVEPSVVWRSCHMAAEMGYVSQTDDGRFYTTQEPAP